MSKPNACEYLPAHSLAVSRTSMDRPCEKQTTSGTSCARIADSNSVDVTSPHVLPRRKQRTQVGTITDKPDRSPEPSPTNLALTENMTTAFHNGRHRLRRHAQEGQQVA